MIEVGRFLEMLSSFGGNKHELSPVDIKLKRVHGCPSFEITYA